MLILTRRPGEEIKIGEDVYLKVVRICRGDQVVLGFDAPREIDIVRTELLDNDTGHRQRTGERRDA